MLCASENKNSWGLFFCILLNYSAKKLSGALRKVLWNAKIVLIQNIFGLEQHCISLNWSAGTISMAVLSSLGKC